MGAGTALAYIRYTRARKERSVWGRVAAAGWQRWPTAAHDTFISCKARNAQYSKALPYVKSRQIAKNRLVFPN